jgi:hypothetical protein
VRYWWVNQHQTFRQEIEGGYLWSPILSEGRSGNRSATVNADALIRRFML